MAEPPFRPPINPWDEYDDMDEEAAIAKLNTTYQALSKDNNWGYAQVFVLAVYAIEHIRSLDEEDPQVRPALRERARELSYDVLKN